MAQVFVNVALILLSVRGKVPIDARLEVNLMKMTVKQESVRAENPGSTERGKCGRRNFLGKRAKSLMVCLVLFSGHTRELAAQVTGETTKIVFCSLRDGNYEVYAMAPDGHRQVNLTQHPAMDGSPSLSPDGSKLAFSSTRDGNLEIYTMEVDGTGLKRLTRNREADNSPRWSPDGTRIVFVSERDGNSEIYAMSADGTEQKRLTRNKNFDGTPTWSPDGRRIAFSSEMNGIFGICAMNADGGAVLRLTDRNDGDPAWSPDGRALLFASDRSGNTDIYVECLDGTSPKRLTSDPAVDGAPIWSPDGTQIAFMSNRDGDDEIFVMNADGTSQVNLTKNNSVDSYPFWGRVPGTGLMPRLHGEPHTLALSVHPEHGIWPIDGKPLIMALYTKEGRALGGSISANFLSTMFDLSAVPATYNERQKLAVAVQINNARQFEHTVFVNAASMESFLIDSEGIIFPDGKPTRAPAAPYVLVRFCQEAGGKPIPLPGTGWKISVTQGARQVHSHLTPGGEILLDRVSTEAISCILTAPETGTKYRHVLCPKFRSARPGDIYYSVWNATRPELAFQD